MQLPHPGGLRKRRSLVARSAIASLENSHRRNAPSVFALLSILLRTRLRTSDNANALRSAFTSSRCPFILALQTGHFGLFTSVSVLPLLSVEKTPEQARQGKSDTLFETPGSWSETTWEGNL